jgi:hypothetical protein
VLGPPVQAEPMVLGGVEIELGHAFDGRKALIGKSLGFPLISIDITEMTLQLGETELPNAAGQR